jgi:hypothetical protein
MWHRQQALFALYTILGRAQEVNDAPWYAQWSNDINNNVSSFELTLVSHCLMTCTELELIVCALCTFGFSVKLLEHSEFHFHTHLSFKQACNSKIRNTCHTFD